MIHGSSTILQPLGPDFPGRKRDSGLFDMQVALRVDDHPLPKLVRPDLGDSMVAASHSFRAVLAVDADLTSLPPECGSALGVSNRVVRAPERFSPPGVRKDFQGIVVADFRAPSRNGFVYPLLQQQLALPFVTSLRGKFLNWVPRSQVDQCIIFIVWRSIRQSGTHRHGDVDL